MASKVNQRLNRTVTKDGVLEWINREACLVIEKIRRALNDVIDGYTSPSAVVAQGHLARFTNALGTLIEDAGRQLVTREIGNRRVVYVASAAEPADESVPQGDGVVHWGIAANRPVTIPTDGQLLWNDEDYGLTGLGEDGLITTLLPIGDISGNRTQFNRFRGAGEFVSPTVGSLQTISSLQLGSAYGKDLVSGTLLVRATSVAFSTPPGGEDPDPAHADALELVACIRVDSDGSLDVFGVQGGNSDSTGLVSGEIYSNATIDVSGGTVRLRTELLTNPAVTLIYSTLEVFGFHQGPVTA